MKKVIYIALVLITCKTSAQNVVFSFSVDNSDPTVSVVSVFAEGTQNTNNELTTFGVRLYYDINEASVTLPSGVNFQGAMNFGWNIGTNTTATNNVGDNPFIPITHTNFLEIVPFDEDLAGDPVPMGAPTLFFTVTFNKSPGMAGTGGEVYLGATDTDPSLAAADENLDPFDVVAIGDRQLLLPLRLIDFSALVVENKSTLLKWITQNENNTSHFDIERSFNGLDWKKIGQVDAAGYSENLREYSFLDANVYNGRTPSMTAYYRLRMLDLDDHYKFSPIESVQFKNELAGTTPFVTYPNPAREGVTIEWDAYAIGQPTTLELFDAAGKLLLSRDVAPNSTQEYIDFTQAKAATGLCLVRLLASGEILDVKQIMIGQN